MPEIVDIVDEGVGKKFSKKEIEAIFKEGATRHEKKTPPGYRDYSKHNNPTTIEEKRSVFGDLIIWKQTTSQANETKTPVIFTTDDAKDDWWLEALGKTIGPRTDFLDEFFEMSGQKFFMYRPDQFLRHAKEHLDSEVSRETIDEIRATDGNRASQEEREMVERNFYWLFEMDPNRKERKQGAASRAGDPAFLLFVNHNKMKPETSLESDPMQYSSMSIRKK